MKRITLFVLILAVLAAGCTAVQKTEEEKRREQYRLSHIPDTHKPAFLKANDKIGAGDRLYIEAKNAVELREKRRLLNQAAASYRNAIVMLQDINENVSNPKDKKYINDVIAHTRISLQETVDLFPMPE